VENSVLLKFYFGEFYEKLSKPLNFHLNQAVLMMILHTSTNTSLSLSQIHVKEVS
jgi:hypothetical protein